MKTKILALLSFLLCSNAFAWGSLGHRTVGIIAEPRLNANAKQAIQYLLGKETVSDVASWADGVRADGTYRQSVWYHFEKMPDDLSYIENLKALSDWQKKKGGVVSAILMADYYLRSSAVNSQLQTDALKFLVHFVGDIHQPLHSGRPEDNGGVKIKIKWFGEEMSVHRVWDSGMIYTGHKDILGDVSNLTGASDNYARYLEKKFGRTKIKEVMDVEGWLNESLALRPAAYDKIYETDQYKYQSLHLPEVDRRVYEAGVRLAAMLNSIFDGQPTPSSQVELWKKAEGVVGDLKKIVYFTP